MLKITIDAPRAFTADETAILTMAFEKLSQLATMFHDEKPAGEMCQHVSVSYDELRLIDAIDKDGKLVEVSTPVSSDAFVKTMRLANATTVTFERDGEVITRPLCPGIPSYAGTFAWMFEPDFIIRLTEEGTLDFELFDGLAKLMHYEKDSTSVSTTMIVGGKEIWSM